MLVACKGTFQNVREAPGDGDFNSYGACMMDSKKVIGSYFLDRRVSVSTLGEISTSNTVYCSTSVATNFQEFRKHIVTQLKSYFLFAEFYKFNEFSQLTFAHFTSRINSLLCACMIIA